MAAAVPSDDSWYFTVEQLRNQPSMEDGVTYDEFVKRKHRAFRFLLEMSVALRQPAKAVGPSKDAAAAAQKQANAKNATVTRITNTAMVLYHRFFVYQSMAGFNWLHMAWCCLFVAYKCEEKVVKMEWLLKWSHSIVQRLKKIPMTKLETESKLFMEMKETLQFNERTLLQTIGFDVEIKQTGAMMIKCAKMLQSLKVVELGRFQELVKLAYAWSNASYGSELCLMYTPDILGCAFLYGAAKDKEVAMQDPPDKRWWDVCLPPKNQITETALVDIMQQFFDFCKLREEFLDIQLPCDPQLYAAADHASKKRRV